MPKNKQNNLLEKIWDLLNTNTVQLSSISSHVAVLNQEMGDVKVDIKDIKNGYVTKEVFSPVQKIVYSLAGAVLLAVLGAVLALVVKK